MTIALHICKVVAKYLNFRYELGHSSAVQALIPGVAVFQSAVRLLPCCLVPAHLCCPGQQISAAAGQRMELRVVGCADGAAQVSLPRSPSSSTAGDQMPGKID